MEKKHKQRLVENFQYDIIHKQIVVLNIPDEYLFMDEELVESIQSSVRPYLDDE
jgi:predicted protein tyrosine phosphatase